MTGRQQWWTALAAVTFAALGPTMATAQTPPSESDEGATFSATVVITHGIIDASGARVRDLPSARYRIAQLADGRVRMKAIAPSNTAPDDAAANRFVGMTVQADPSTGRIDVRDRNGAQVGLPSASGGPWLETARVSDALVATSDGRVSRRAAIERAFGRPVGRLRGHDRFVERRDRGMRELLVSPDTALPSELNVVEDGALTERHTFTYVRLRDVGWVRQRTSSEALMPGSGGRRVVTTTTLDDVVVAAGGVR